MLLSINRNQQGNSGFQLIPWKVSVHNEKAEFPLRSSIITVVTTVCFIPGIWAHWTGRFHDRINIYMIALSTGLWVTTHLPCLLLFTINHRKNTVQIQPPTGLQFHEPEDSDETNVSTRENLGDLIFFQKPTYFFKLICFRHHF